jgi:hypothetical protein
LDQPFSLREKTFLLILFFPAKIFSGILEKENLYRQNFFGGKKVLLAKNCFPFSKKGFSYFFLPNFSILW